MELKVVVYWKKNHK